MNSLTSNRNIIHSILGEKLQQSNNDCSISKQIMLMILDECFSCGDKHLEIKCSRVSQCSFRCYPYQTYGVQKHCLECLKYVDSCATCKELFLCYCNVENCDGCNESYCEDCGEFTFCEECEERFCCRTFTIEEDGCWVCNVCNEKPKKID